jgi:carboxypeptidase family protein
MMRVRITLRSVNVLLAALLIAGCARLVHAQSRLAPGTIDGVVTDANLASLTDATASILGSTIRVVTGANGRFRIVSVPAGQYILVVTRLGYRPSSMALQVAGGDTLRMSFTLERIATALDTIAITAKRYSMRMGEFEERRKLGFGQFMTQAEIEKRNSVFPSELMRTFMSVVVVLTDRGFGHKAMSYRGGCEFQVYLDGTALPPPVNLDNLPTPKDLAGIEVYSGPAQIPLQYKTTAGGGFCGVILVWTKDGS